MIKIKPAGPGDYDTLMRIWTSSVQATHHFLQEEDFLWYQANIADLFFPQVSLYGLWDEAGMLQGFLGVSQEMIEMLFIDADARGMGYGKDLLHYATETLALKKVDVNEQNEQAVDFYKSQGFKVYERSDKDGMGKDYPILHMQL